MGTFLSPELARAPREHDSRVGRPRYFGRMSSYGELVPGRKLKDEQDEGGIAKNYDPGGPLDLDNGVVYLAPPAQNDDEDTDEDGQAPQQS